MYPVILDLGPIKLHTYGLLIAVGFLVALYFIRRDGARRLGLDGETVNEMGFWMLLTGLAGTRLFHVLLYPEDYTLTDPLGWVNVMKGGLVFQGAIPAALIYYWWAARRKKVPFWAGLDIAFPYLPLAHAFGRIGCLMYGCCYGKPTDLPWGIQFPVGSPAWSAQLHAQGAAHTFALHPTQLYSAAGLILLMALLLLIRRHFHKFDGMMAPAYLILYGVFRFVVEFFRGDGNPTHMGTFTDQQVIALLMAAIGVALFAVLSRYMPPPTPRASQEPESGKR